MSRDPFFGLLKLLFLSQTTKLKWYDFGNRKRFELPKNQLILQKTAKKLSKGSFLKEKYGSGCTQISQSPITRVLRVVVGFRWFTPLLKLFQWYKFDFEIKNCN